LRLPLAGRSDDILIITPSDHIIDDMEAYETAIEALRKQLKDTLLLWNCPLNRQDMDTERKVG
jgi:mannose-1-phosphate guanylyltransferase